MKFTRIAVVLVAVHGVGCGVAQVDFPLVRDLTARSQLVVINGALAGTVVPVVNGRDLVRERRISGRTATLVARLAPGEQAAVMIRAPHPRTMTVVFKYYDESGAFVGATAPQQLHIPAQPQTTRVALVFRPEELRR